MLADVPFESCHCGRCSSCKDSKPLDMMVKNERGYYDCLDCVVEKESSKLDVYTKNLKGLVREPDFASEVEPSKVSKLMRWLLG